MQVCREERGLQAVSCTQPWMHSAMSHASAARHINLRCTCTQPNTTYTVMCHIMSGDINTDIQLIRAEIKPSE